jgi:hypothetical protein
LENGLYLDVFESTNVFDAWEMLDWGVRLGEVGLTAGIFNAGFHAGASQRWSRHLGLSVRHVLKADAGETKNSRRLLRVDVG